MTDTEVLSEGCVVNIVTTGGGWEILLQEKWKEWFMICNVVLYQKSAEVNYGVIAI